MAADRKHGVTDPDTVETVQVGAPATAGHNVREVGSVEVINVSGSDPLYVSVDGVDPAVRGDSTYVIPPGGWSRISARGVPPLTVKLISASAVTYGVEAFYS